MGLFIKNDLEKLLKDAEKKALVPDQNDALSSYGDRMRQQMAILIGRDKAYGYHLEAKISGGSLFLSPFNKMTKKGRAFEELMDKQGSEEYNARFHAVKHDVRLKKEDLPEDEIADALAYQSTPEEELAPPGEEKLPEFVQDVRRDLPRNGFAMHRGKNDVVVDSVLTGRMYTEELDKGGFKRRVLAPYGLMDMKRDSVHTGGRTETEDGKDWELRDSIDNFQTEFAKRVEAAEKANNELLRELGYDLLERSDDGYVAQRVEIENDPRYIEIFPDLTDLPKIVGAEGTYEPEYDIVIHINGQKVQPQDIDLAFHQLTRKGAYEKSGLESGREFLIQQGVRGAAFHASVLPQQMISSTVKAPAKAAREGQQALAGTVLQQLMAALTRGMSR